MDTCFRLIVAVTITSQLTSGRTYKGYKYDSYDHFHHGFENLDPDRWPDDHDWQAPDFRHPRTFRPETGNWDKSHYNHGQDHDERYWRLHHPANSDWSSGSNSWSSGRPGSWSDHDSYWNHGSNEWNNQNNNNFGWNHNNQGRPGTWGQQRPSTAAPTTLKPTTLAPTTAAPAITTAPSGTANPRQGVTQSPFVVALCIRSCPVTSEYNPVCGSNNVTYGNPGRLECARNCGVDVNLRRNSACPPPGMPDTSTPEPAQPSSPPMTNVPPTRFTTVDIPAPSDTPNSAGTNAPFTISPDVLSSIFTLPPDDDNVDIDIRTRSKFVPQYIHPVRI